MIPFEEIWRTLYDHGASSKKEEGTRRYWEQLSPEQQERVFTTISRKLREGKFVQYDPIRAIKENIRLTGKNIMSADAYYRHYGTQENQDGWVRTFLEDQHKTIYIRL